MTDPIPSESETPKPAPAPEKARGAKGLATLSTWLFLPILILLVVAFVLQSPALQNTAVICLGINVILALASHKRK